MVDGIIMLFGGLLVCYYAWYGGKGGGLNAQKVQQWADWHQTYGRLMKIGGPIIAGLGALRILQAIVS